MRYLLVGSLVLAVVAPIAAQTATSRRKPTERNPGKPLPRAADGRPDLQGIWTNDTFTPLERPEGFEDKAFFAEAEEAAFQQQVRDGIRALLGEDNQKTTGDVGYTEFGQLLPDRRTSLIVDPVHGKMPPLVRGAHRLEASGRPKADGPEDFDAPARCLSWPSPPMLPPPNNTQVQVVQMHDYVMILGEVLARLASFRWTTVHTFRRLYVGGRATHGADGKAIRWSWTPRISGTRARPTFSIG
jgi:hypothetical protein